MIRKFRLAKVNCKRSRYGWNILGSDTIINRMEISADLITPRKICKLLRRTGHLSDKLTGNIAVDMCDDKIQILKKNSGRPLLSLEYLN